ncbi:hypothetical protein FSP39_017888 [Pinctada imbricata]|uniref:BTB domain-containing protein n=1 Tax=Pinctada imbricata TaxID=66713 RepID=A0AA88Y0Z4_PINIB|nr:hypothetical protein FSP39_017888 [Pinctada imbricata]
MDNLHFNFSAFVQKAKDYVDERDYHIRQRERDINIRETYIDDLILKLEEKASKLDAQIESCQRQMTESESRQRDMEADYSKKKEELDRTYDNKHQDLKRERDAFEMERDHFHAELKRMSEMYKIQDGRIKLDIGGHQFTTSLTTLTRDPESMLAAMFSGRHQLKVEQDGSYFIDRDGVHFRYILNYLRDGGIKDGTIPHNENVWRELLTEAEYYQINGLTEYLASLLYKRERDDSDTFV